MASLYFFVRYMAAMVALHVNTVGRVAENTECRAMAEDHADQGLHAVKFKLSRGSTSLNIESGSRRAFGSRDGPCCGRGQIAFREDQCAATASIIASPPPLLQPMKTQTNDR